MEEDSEQEESQREETKAKTNYSFDQCSQEEIQPPATDNSQLTNSAAIESNVLIPEASTTQHV